MTKIVEVLSTIGGLIAFGSFLIWVGYSIGKLIYGT